MKKQAKPKPKPRTRRNGTDGPRRQIFKPVWMAAAWLAEEHAVELGIIADHGKDRNALAKRLGMDPDVFKHVITAAMPIPRDGAVLWADRLNLAGVKRRRYLTLVILSYASESIIDAYLRLDKSIAKLLRGLKERRLRHEERKRKEKKKRDQ